MKDTADAGIALRSGCCETVERWTDQFHALTGKRWGCLSSLACLTKDGCVNDPLADSCQVKLRRSRSRHKDNIVVTTRSGVRSAFGGNECVGGEMRVEVDSRGKGVSDTHWCQRRAFEI